MKKALLVLIVLLVGATTAWGYYVFYRVPADVLTGKSGGSRSATSVDDLYRQLQTGQGVIYQKPD